MCMYSYFKFFRINRFTQKIIRSVLKNQNSVIL